MTPMLSERDRKLIEEWTEHANSMKEVDCRYFETMTEQALQVLSIITRLEKALHKCREQRGICERVDHINGPCRFQIWDQELKDILEGKP